MLMIGRDGDERLAKNKKFEVDFENIAVKKLGTKYLVYFFLSNQR